MPKAKPIVETPHERAKRMRRERYTRIKADTLMETAAQLEDAGKVELANKVQVKGGQSSPSAITKARDNLTSAFDLMGGVPGLVRWGRLNPTEFYRIWARLIPKEAVEASTQQPLEQLLEQLATKSEKSVAEAAYEIGQETLLAAGKKVSIEDATAAFNAENERMH